MRYVPVGNLVMILVLLANFSTAQSNFRKTRIVTLAGDTKLVWVDYLQWEVNPKGITVKEDSASSIISTLTINDISSFEVLGIDKYIRAKILRDITPNHLQSLVVDKVYGVESDTVFLRVLLDSKICLYEYFDFKPHFYITEGQGDFVELKYTHFLTNRGNTLSVREDYKTQLAALIINSTTDKLLQRIKQASYNQKSLIRVVKELNQQQNSELVYSVKESKSDLSFYGGAGVMFSSLQVGERGGVISELNYSKSRSLLIAGGIDIPVLRNLQNLLLRFELSYHTQKFAGGDSVKTNFGADYHNYELKINCFSPMVSFLYNLINSPRNKIYLGAGCATNFSSYPLNRYRGYRSFNSTTEELNPFASFEKFWVSLHAKAGWKLGERMELATSSKIGGTFSNLLSYSLGTSMSSVTINYHF